MSSQLTNQIISQFRGIRTNSNPLGDAERVYNSATSMINFRFLRGMFMRLIGGRKCRWFNAGTTKFFTRIHEFRDQTFTGFQLHMFQENDSAGSTVTTRWKNIATWDSALVITVNGTLDSNFSYTTPAPMCNVKDGVVMYNGWGKRQASGSAGEYSRPALTNWQPSIGYPFYFGLDAMCPSGAAPTVSTSPGGGIELVGDIKVGVAIFNFYTGHFSNVILCGTAAVGIDLYVVISNVNRIAPNYQNAAELNALYYVPFVSYPNSETMYLLIDPVDATKPLMYFCSATTTITLDINSLSDANLDITKPAPYFNHPPRPMRWIAFVNNRLYGSLMVTTGGGNGGWNDGFSYAATGREIASVVYSMREGDKRFTVGVPEQCFPPTNRTPSPNSQVPLFGIAAGKDDYRLFVICPTSCFMVAESIDGIHEWTECSSEFGIVQSGVPTVLLLDKGVTWFNQYQQICQLHPTEAGGVIEVISDAYAPKLRGKVSRFARRVLDPVNAIDRYELYFTDGTALYHDFNTGEGHEVSSADMTCGTAVTDLNGLRYFLLAKRHIYSDAGQPETGLEKKANEDYDAAGVVVRTAITGQWHSQYNDFGQEESTKQLNSISVFGDWPNTTVKVMRDFMDSSVPANIVTLTPDVDSDGTDYGYAADERYMRRFKVYDSWTAKVWKTIITLVGATADESYPALDVYGSEAESGSFRGVIMRLSHKIGITGNRAG